MAHDDLVDRPIPPRPRDSLEVEAQIRLAVFVDIAIAGEFVLASAEARGFRD